MRSSLAKLVKEIGGAMPRKSKAKPKASAKPTRRPAAKSSGRNKRAQIVSKVYWELKKSNPNVTLPMASSYVKEMGLYVAKDAPKPKSRKRGVRGGELVYY